MQPYSSSWRGYDPSGGFHQSYDYDYDPWGGGNRLDLAERVDHNRIDQVTIYHLTQEQSLAVPLDKVFAFFADAGNLDAITPPWMQFQIVTPRPIAMKAGALIDYRLKVHGLPLKWQSEITVWEPPHRFVDVQRRGPYRHWVHEHTFEERDGGTLLRDKIEYAVPGWFLAPLVNRWLVAPDLKKIFEYRRESIARLL